MTNDNRTNQTSENSRNWVQKIYFGCPGVGKSHGVRTKHEIKGDTPLVECVFHPEYTHGDFMGKLMPLTVGDKVTYRYYPGHFMRALAMAYRAIKEAKNNRPPETIYLVIDEINRGNTAQIFGPVLQLLDRDDDGWSSYAIHLSTLERFALAQEIHGQELKDDGRTTALGHAEKILKECEHSYGEKLNGLADKGAIRLPPNLSIISTMNTSDESIYYMDSAFKRRWDWEYLPIENDNKPESWEIHQEGNNVNWVEFVNKLNTFICEHGASIRNVEDKQIGYWFIKAKNDVVTVEQIKNKLMFFLWDSVFQRDKSPLETLLGLEDNTLVTFGDFANEAETFIHKIMEYQGDGSDKSADD